MRLALRLLAAFAAAFLLPLGALAQPKADYAPREGDVVFQSLEHNPLVDAIEGSTGSPFSHCGIVHRARSGWVVIEAIGPVKETPLADWVAQGRGGRYAVFRLRERYQAQIPAFIRAAQSYAGRPYDIHYDLDDKAIYCSELVWKAYRRATGQGLGQLQTLGQLNWQPYADVIREIEDGELPLHRRMITPRALSEARQLRKVYPAGNRIGRGDAAREPTESGARAPQMPAIVTPRWEDELERGVIYRGSAQGWRRAR